MKTYLRFTLSLSFSLSFLLFFNLKALERYDKDYSFSFIIYSFICSCHKGLSLCLIKLGMLKRKLLKEEWKERTLEVMGKRQNCELLLF